MVAFNEDNFDDLSIEEINELYDDIIEMPSPIIAGVASEDCEPKGGFTWSG